MVNGHKSEFRHRFPHRTSSGQTGTLPSSRGQDLFPLHARSPESAIVLDPTESRIGGPSEITFSKLIPLKCPICIPGCYGNVRLTSDQHQGLYEGCWMFTKLERIGQRAIETPMTHDSPPNRSVSTLKNE